MGELGDKGGSLSSWVMMLVVGVRQGSLQGSNHSITSVGSTAKRKQSAFFHNGKLHSPDSHQKCRKQTQGAVIGWFGSRPQRGTGFELAENRDSLRDKTCSPSQKGCNKYEYAESHYDTGVRR